jgi:peptide/nickel transport system permease protein
MAINTTAAPMPAESLLTETWQRLRGLAGGVRRNPKLLLGLVLVFGLIGFGAIGPHFVNVSEARPMSVFPDQKPSRAYPFGTESQGRSLLALVVKGIPLTVEVGLIAGAIGLGIGTVLGFIAG